jgi:hypothetical protein
MRTLGGSPNTSGALEQRNDARERFLVEAAADLHDVTAPQIDRDGLAPLRRRRLRVMPGDIRSCAAVELSHLASDLIDLGIDREHSSILLSRCPPLFVLFDG